MPTNREFECPHCHANIDYVKYRCYTSGREYGDAYFSQTTHRAEIVDQESNEHEIDDSHDYVYFCPECDEEVDLDNLTPISEPAVTPFRYDWVDGMRVACNIGASRNVLCVVTIERNQVYLCQNERSGHDCNDKKNMTYSWSLGSGTEAECRRNDVSEIRYLAALSNTWSNLL